MSNVELPTSLLVFFYVLIIIFCIVVVVVVVIIAPDLYRHFQKNEGSIGGIYKCSKYLDEGDVKLYEECVRGEIKK